MASIRHVHMGTQTRKRILVADALSHELDTLRKSLEQEGFNVTIVTGEEAVLAVAGNCQVDLLLFDLNAPGIRGLEMCRMLKADRMTSDLPFIILSAEASEVDQILALKLGAEDFIRKPFNPKVLATRINTVLRRYSRASKMNLSSGTTLLIGSLIIDQEKFTVTKNGIPLTMSPVEFKLLRYLAERKGEIIARDQLLHEVWNRKSSMSSRTVDVHVRRLRALIEDDPSNPTYIKTKRGTGYYMDRDL